VTHLPVRWRLTLAFACVMAILLAATGLFVRRQLGAHLDRALDASLRSQAADVAALAQQSDSGLNEAKDNRILGGRVQVAQLIDARGRVIDASAGVPRRPLIAATALARAREHSVVIRSMDIAGDEAFRLLAVPINAQDQRMVAVVGQSLEERDQAITGLTNVLLLGGPIALVLASLAGFGLTGAALRPVEVMRRRERAFIADASHELRSPLAMLRTELELMARDRPSGAELQAATASAIEETERIGRLADDLLLLTRADSRRLALHRAPVSPGELVVAAAARARRRPAPREVRIRVADGAGTPLLMADVGRIAQAIDNMLDNALRHATSEVELSTRVTASSVEIHVLDDGPGFPPEFLSRAWERFSRADPARTDDGAGLGLSIVRTIAEGHGGRTEASNRPDGGADVCIVLPVG
jgi:signal transduction histidine kinase